jgi:TMEM175 potassium channel family protein
MRGSRVAATVAARKTARREQHMPQAELDLRLQRLLFFSDGVYAIAVTLLAVELVLPEATADLHGGELLDSLLESWPRVLAFVTSFLFIANFWVGHNILFYQVRRFDGGLMWLVLLQLLCIAFLPFPTSVVGEHVSDPVAQQFYLTSLFLTGLAMWALWWYMSSGRRLVDPDLGPQAIRRVHLISSGVPASVLLLMVLVAMGVGRLVNPLLLAYLLAFAYVVLGVFEGREPIPAEESGGSSDEVSREGSPARDERGETDRPSG